MSPNWFLVAGGRFCQAGIGQGHLDGGVERGYTFAAGPRCACSSLPRAAPVRTGKPDGLPIRIRQPRVTNRVDPSPGELDTSRSHGGRESEGLCRRFGMEGDVEGSVARTVEGVDQRRSSAARSVTCGSTIEVVVTPDRCRCRRRA